MTSHPGVSLHSKTIAMDSTRYPVHRSLASLGAFTDLALAVDPGLDLISVVPRTKLAARGGYVHLEFETAGL